MEDTSFSRIFSIFFPLGSQSAERKLPLSGHWKTALFFPFDQASAAPVGRLSPRNLLISSLAQINQKLGAQHNISTGESVRKKKKKKVEASSVPSIAMPFLVSHSQKGGLVWAPSKTR